MGPITLHLNIFQAGANSEGRKSLRVDNPQTTTVRALKKQLFPEALEDQRSIRFIAGGRVLDDAASLGRCGINDGAFIHVSIAESAQPCGQPPQPRSSDSAGSAGSGSPTAKKESDPGASEDGFSASFSLGVVFFAGTGAALLLAWRRRRHLTMHMSQCLFILAAVWAYGLLCHGLPALLQLCVRLSRNFGHAAPGGRGDGYAGCGPAVVSTAMPPGASAAAGQGLGPASATAALQEGHSTARARPLSGATPLAPSGAWN